MHWKQHNGLLVMKKSDFSARGFTLIELMVTVALVAILMAVAVPSMTTFQRNAELTSFSNTMTAAVNAARGEAMKRGRYAMVVPLDGSNWSSGWVVFVDIDRSQAYEAANDVTLLTRDAIPSYLEISANGTAAASPPYIMFDASGYVRQKGGGLANQTFNIQRNDVSGADALAQTRRIIISRPGRVRTCTPKTSTDATCSASSSS
jgi:type IV fimbrial biogenesis protein FimT